MYANERYNDIVKNKHLIEAGGWALLNHSAYNGDTDTVKSLIATGADVNAKEKDGWTPLHHSAHKGHADIVNTLIAAGADVNAKDRKGYTPLHHSVDNGNADIVNALIAAGADVNANKGNGWIPLYYCGRDSHADIANALIAAGAEVNAKDKHGWTPLLRVAFVGNADSAKALISAGADVNVQDDSGWTSLHHVAQAGCAHTAKELITAGANVNVTVFINGWTPLHVSAQNGHTDIVKALITAGADVNAKADFGWTPLHSLNNGSSDIERALARRGGRVEGPRVVWPFNAGRGHTDIAKLLLAAGADIDAKDDQGRTALHPYLSHTNEVSKALIKYALLYQCGSKWKKELEHGNGLLSEYQNECEEEIKTMKEIFLGDSCTSVFKYIMEKNENKLAFYSLERIFGIKDELGRVSYIERFPIYAEHIEAQFSKGMERANLLDKSQELMTHFFCPTLIPEITRKISEYMTSDELKNFLMINDSLE